MSSFICECAACCAKYPNNDKCDGDFDEWGSLHEQFTDRERQAIINKSHWKDEVIIVESEHLYLVWDKES